MAHYRSNPDVFGEDVMGLAWNAVGLTLTAVIDDHVVAPSVKGFAGSLTANPTAAKVVDSVTTGVVAYAVGEGVGMVDGAIGRRMKLGGMILAAGRFISAFIPGFQISGSFPTSIGGSALALPGGKVATASSGSPATQAQPVNATPTPGTPQLPPGAGTYPAFGSRLAANQNAAL